MSSFFDLFEQLYKRDLPEEGTQEFDTIFERQNFESMIHGIDHHLQIERRVNGFAHRKDLEKIYQHDVEIYSAWDKRVQAVKNSKLELQTENKQLKKFFEEQIIPFEDQLKEDFLWSVAYGYNVEQIIYKEDRSGEVEGFQRENFWRFQPQRDGVHVMARSSGHFQFADMNKMMPYGKWILTTHKGSAVKPMGESLFARLYLPWLWRCSGMDEWVRFAQKHGRGFLIGTTPKRNDVEKLGVVLDNAVKGASIAVTEGTQLEYLQSNSQGDLYKKLDDQLVNMILRGILGETQTSKMSERGSSQSAGVHNEVRIEKTKSDVKLIENGINEVIRQIAAVNEIEADDLPVAKIHLDQGLELARAERDSKLKTSGVQFSKEYYIRNYGFKEDEIEVVESSPVASILKRGDIGIEFAEGMPEQKFGVEYVDDVVELLEKLNISPLKDKALFKAVKDSSSYIELRQKTADLFDDADNPDFVEQIAKALYSIAIVGAAEADNVDEEE